MIESCSVRGEGFLVTFFNEGEGKGEPSNGLAAGMAGRGSVLSVKVDLEAACWCESGLPAAVDEGDAVLDKLEWRIFEDCAKGLLGDRGAAVMDPGLRLLGRDSGEGRSGEFLCLLASNDVVEDSC